MNESSTYLFILYLLYQFHFASFLKEKNWNMILFYILIREAVVYILARTNLKLWKLLKSDYKK